MAPIKPMHFYLNHFHAKTKQTYIPEKLVIKSAFRINSLLYIFMKLQNLPQTNPSSNQCLTP